jgi:hypothetical protein
MEATRRTAIAMLGLAATPVGGESFANPLPGASKNPSGFSFAIAKREDFASALRALADDIEKGGTYPQSVELRSRASIEDFMEHTLTIKFAMNENPPAV